MKKRPKTIFAEHRGKLYVLAEFSGVHPLILLSSGELRVCHFSGDKQQKQYVEIDELAAWHAKEIRDYNARESVKVLPLIEKIIRKFKLGDWVDSGK